MNSSSSTVSAELGFRLVVPQQTIVPLVASLYYSSDDPYAIRIAFHVGLDEPVEWIFARDLLSRGIQGIGDGHMRPSPGPAGGEPGGVLNIELILPYGQGSGHIDTDTELNDLLRQAS
jgi:hypothetical protein